MSRVMYSSLKIPQRIVLKGWRL